MIHINMEIIKTYIVLEHLNVFGSVEPILRKVYKLSNNHYIIERVNSKIAVLSKISLEDFCKMEDNYINTLC